MFLPLKVLDPVLILAIASKMLRTGPEFFSIRTVDHDMHMRLM